MEGLATKCTQFSCKYLLVSSNMQCCHMRQWLYIQRAQDKGFKKTGSCHGGRLLYHEEITCCNMPLLQWYTGVPSYLRHLIIYMLPRWMDKDVKSLKNKSSNQHVSIAYGEIKVLVPSTMEDGVALECLALFLLKALAKYALCNGKMSPSTQCSLTLTPPYGRGCFHRPQDRSLLQFRPLVEDVTCSA